MTYKKRAKAGWNSDKDSSNKSERVFEKQEVNNLLESAETEDSQYVEPEDKFVSSGQKTKKRQYDYPEEKKIKKLEKRINNDKKFIEKMEMNRTIFSGGGDWASNYVMNRKAAVKKDSAKLAKLREILKQKKEKE